MYTMRDRLLAEQDAQEALDAHQLHQRLLETAQLASTLTKLEHAEDQLRTLQATLIAERVKRVQLQEKADKEEDDMRQCRDELANAIRALRRARDEGRRGEDEKKSLTRGVEALRLK
jgi:hypothetical protein